MNKFIRILLVLSLIALGVMFFIYRNSKLDYEKEISELKEARKEELKAVRDSAFVQIESIVNRSRTTYDSLLTINQEIKYVPYEKLRYVDRTIDDALDVIADYNYSKTRQKN